MVGAAEILGPNGRPARELEELGGRRNGHAPVGFHEPTLIAQTKFLQNAVAGYLQSLKNSSLPASIRAEDPLSNHAWVLAAAMVIATTAAQAPFVVMRETEEQLERRRKKTVAAGRPWTGARAGSRRRSFHRHMQQPLMKRLVMKDAEPDFDHPLMDLLVQPNPLQTGDLLFQTTLLFLVVRGEVFWVKGNGSSNPVGPGETPEQLWPLSPDLFQEILSHGSHGELVGWWFTPPRWMPNATASRGRIALSLDHVVQFKLPNPSNPMRGMSRLSAVAQGIELDLSARSYTANLIKNRAVPKGILEFEGTLNAKEQAEYRETWEAMHKGAENADRVGILHSGFKWKDVALSPADMQFLEQSKWDREEILAVLGCPPSLLGLTQFTNYATALSQDKSFWDKTILPLFRLIEAVIDSTLLFPETDETFGMFDLRGIEALRAGLADKTTIVASLTSPSIHMPPRQALEVADLQTDEYEGDEDALVPSTVVPVRLATDDDFQGLNDPVIEPGMVPGEAPGSAPARPVAAAIRRSASAKRRGGAKRWRAFLKIETKLERPARGAYRAWTAGQRSRVLVAFDHVTRGKGPSPAGDVFRKDSVDLTAIFPELAELQSALKSLIRPTYAGVLEAAWDFTVEDLGVPVFSIDSEAILGHFDLREARLLSQSAKTLLGRLKSSLAQGVSAGDTLAQMRDRIAHVFDVAQSSSKTLTWARTEVSGLFSGVRNQMFREQGVEKHSWTTAGDESVREDHETFGALSPKPLEYDYLQEVGRSDGSLTHPHDVNAPVDQIINCRCVEVVE